MADISFQAIKIGLLGSAEITTIIADRLSSLPEVPVVLDPVLKAGGGANLYDGRLMDALVNSLLPRVTLLTPNFQEARLLGQYDSMDDCAKMLLEKGCRGVLITGGDEETPSVQNYLYDGQTCQIYTWKRLTEGAHGSGCTLASAIAALIAQGLDLTQAVEQAQQYTWNSLCHAFRPGHGQKFPRRLQ